MKIRKNKKGKFDADKIADKIAIWMVNAKNDYIRRTIELREEERKLRKLCRLGPSKTDLEECKNFVKVLKRNKIWKKLIKNFFDRLNLRHYE